MEQTELEIVLELLKRKELHVRGIAKVISQPHANVSRTMKKLLNKNIVDFRLEGKNKLFRLKKGLESLNYAYMAEHFKLSKLLEKYDYLSAIIEPILEKTGQKLIIIFGSYAKFNAKKGSDIDVFIATSSRKLKTEIEDINLKLSVKIGELNKKNPLVREIIQDHVILRGVESYYEINKIFD